MYVCMPVCRKETCGNIAVCNPLKINHVYRKKKVSYPDIIFIYPDIKLSYPDVKRVQSGVILYLALLLCTFTIIITTNT